MFLVGFVTMSLRHLRHVPDNLLSNRENGLLNLEPERLISVSKFELGTSRSKVQGTTNAPRSKTELNRSSFLIIQSSDTSNVFIFS